VKLLVIGKSGQVAQALAACDGLGGTDVVALGRPDVDLVKLETLRAALQNQNPDVVINAAAYTAVDQAEREPRQAFAINETGAGNVATVCAEQRCPLIHISTDYVFDGSKQTPYCEADPVAPLGVYGQSKAAGEQRVAETCPHHVILRTAWVHSPHGSNFIKTMLRLATERLEISVVNDQVGSPTYAPHLADAILAVAENIFRLKAHTSWGIYHAAGHGEASWYDVAQKTFDVAASVGGARAKVHPIPASDYPTPARRPANSRLNCESLKQSFAITMPEWELGVEACVRQLVTNSSTNALGTKSRSTR